ncbi:MAG: Xaa-Pro peptidase family protein [bacterium]
MNQSSPAKSLPQTEFMARLRKLQVYQKREKLDVLLISTETNRYYLMGFCASDGLLVLTDEPTFYTDFRYFVAAKKALPFLKVKLIWKTGEESGALAQIGKKWKRIGYEGALSAERFGMWREVFASVEFVKVSAAIDELRSIKSLAEQRCLRAAVRATDAVFAAVRSQMTPGMTEWDVRNLIRRGADFCGQGEAFDSVVCVGKNAAECHHHPDETRLLENGSVLIDMGVLKDYYCSDMTRSFCLGKSTAEYRGIYKIVLEANLKAIHAIRPGRACSEIDAIARKHIEKAGYGKQFGHGLGHSVGLEIHESPRFSVTCNTVLKPGMIMTVEPGIYLSGRFGVRIEDVVLVTRTGCEVLTKTDK